MVTDEQLIAFVRSSMDTATAEIHPPPGLLDGIHPSRRPRLRPPSIGGLAAALSTALAVGVAGLVVILLGHGHARTTRSVTTPGAAVPGPTSLATLRSELAILRRPQRAIDRLPHWGVTAEERPKCSNCVNIHRLMPSASRLLTTIPTNTAAGGRTRERVYLVLGTVPRRWQVGRFVSGWHQSGDSARGLHLSLVGLGRFGLGDGVRVPVQAPDTESLLNYSQSPMPAQALTPRDVLISRLRTVGVVPDGVTRVKWELANPGQKKPAIVYPAVHGNVATAPSTPAPRSTALLTEQWLVGATWYAADGHVIASYRTSLAELDKWSRKG